MASPLKNWASILAMVGLRLKTILGGRGRPKPLLLTICAILVNIEVGPSLYLMGKYVTNGL